MDLEKKTQLLQAFYAGVLADSVLRLGNEGVLERVTVQKRKEQMATGKARASQMGINSPEQVFTFLSEVFACANWQISAQPNGFVALTPSCRLCAIAKRMGAPSPCDVHCLAPMEGMVKGISPESGFDVKETLWNGAECRVEVFKTETA